MTEALATIDLIQEIIPHTNAERLEIARVKGYRVIVQKDLHKVGDKIVFIVPDTILPDVSWAESFKKYAPKRVRAIKIRGEYSMGIIMPLSAMLEQYPDLDTTLEADIAEAIGVTKYEAPVPSDLQAKGSLPFGIFKTDETRYQALNLPFGSPVQISLKKDGQSATYYCKKIGDQWSTGILSRTLEIKPECENNYTRMNTQYKIFEKLQGYCEKHNLSLALRGEICGNRIQGFANNPDAGKPLNWSCFSVLDLDTLQYYRLGSAHNYLAVCEELDLPAVPTEADTQILTQELIDLYANADEHPTFGLPFEGVVMQTEKMSFKVINLNYDAKK